MIQRDGARAFTMLNPSLAAEPNHEFMQNALARGRKLEALPDTARQLGHQPTGWLRSDEEYASACSRGAARRGARRASTRAPGYHAAANYAARSRT
ncbi:MAG: hypothetical protein M3065_07500 [Actinomycetota bacterium]|nr:hypothetical protein [Actinomycetota bacterium]